MTASPVLLGLTENHLRTLAQNGVSRTFRKNTVVINEGDATDALYIILSGKVKVYLADEAGKEVVLTTEGPGGYFGEMVLDGGPRSASVMTLETSTFSVVGKNEFKKFLTEHPDVSVHIIEKLIARTRALTSFLDHRTRDRRGVRGRRVYGAQRALRCRAHARIRRRRVCIQEAGLPARAARARARSRRHGGKLVPAVDADVARLPRDLLVEWIGRKHRGTRASPADLAAAYQLRRQISRWQTGRRATGRVTTEPRRKRRALRALT